jgi:hypothetical protein
MKKDKAESSQKYCECEYIKQTDTDIVDLFRPPVLIANRSNTKNAVYEP